MPINIPLRSDLPHFDLQAVLSGVVFTLEFKWNTRERAWYLNVQSETGDDVINGVKLIVDFPLGRRTPSRARPAGVLIAVDTSDAGQNPGWDDVAQKGDLGNRVQLLYYEPAEARLEPAPEA